MRESVSAMSSEIESNQPQSTSTGNTVVSTASNSQVASSITKKSFEDESQTSTLDEGIKSRKDVWREGRRVTKDDFARFMRFASGGKEVFMFFIIPDDIMIFIMYFSPFVLDKR